VKILATFTLKKLRRFLKLSPSGKLETEGVLEKPGPFQVLFIVKAHSGHFGKHNETQQGGKNNTTQ
jgi:hypothetical protein